MDQPSSTASTVIKKTPKTPLPNDQVQGIPLLKDAWVDYASRWKSFIWLFLVLFLFGIVIVSIPILLFGALTFVGVSIGGDVGKIIQDVMLVLMSLAGIAAIFTTIGLGTLSILTLTMNKNKVLRFKETFGFIKSQLPRVRGILWLLFLLIVLTYLGIFALIIPGILLSIWWSQALYVFVKEDLRGFAALKRSFHLMRGYGWYYLYMLLPLAIISALVMLLGIVYLPFLVLGYLILFFVLTPLSYVFHFILFDRIVALNKKHPRSRISAKRKWMLVGTWTLLYAIIIVVSASVPYDNSYGGHDYESEFNFDYKLDF